MEKENGYGKLKSQGNRDYIQFKFSLAQIIC